jgi:hypothetical protein
MRGAFVTLVIVLAIFGLNVFSQTQSVFFSYGRNINGASDYVIIVDNNAPIPVAPVANMCGSLSPNGQFFAQSPMNNPTQISLYSLLENREFYTIPWRSNWYPCTVYWNDFPSHISIQSLADFNTVASAFIFTSDGKMLELSDIPPNTPAIPNLPFSYNQDPQNYIIPSPDNTKFFYRKCEGIFDEFCRSDDNYVLYNNASQQELLMFSNDLKVPILKGPAYTLDVIPPSTGYYAWSPDSRYFMYPIDAITTPIDVIGFAIYDTVSQTHVVYNQEPWQLDRYLKPVFSYDGTKVAFWTEGFADDDASPEEMEQFNTLYVYDLVTGIYTNMPYAVELGGANGTNLVWSPNTHELVFVDIQGNLYWLNANTNTTTIMDTNVTRIVAWNYVEPVPVITGLIPLATDS